MKTREQIYSKEASELLRDITMYHCVKHEQLLMLFYIKTGQYILLR